MAANPLMLGLVPVPYTIFPNSFILRPASNEPLPVELLIVYNLYSSSYSAVVHTESHGWLGFPLP
jgi:hypothetical protein